MSDKVLSGIVFFTVTINSVIFSSIILKNNIMTCKLVFRINLLNCGLCYFAAYKSNSSHITTFWTIMQFFDCIISHVNNSLKLQLFCLHLPIVCYKIQIYYICGEINESTYIRR